MRILFYSCWLLLLFGCPEPPVEAEYSAEFYLEYENLITGEMGTLSALERATTAMYSNAGPTFMPPPPSFRQSIQASFFSDTTDYPFFQLNFYPSLSAELVKPIPGQTFGQLYTYENPEDYLSENFSTGDQLTSPLEFDIRFGLSYPESSAIAKSDLATQTDATFILSEASIFEDDSGIPHLFLRGNFSGTLINDAFGPFSLQPHFQITGGHFACSIPVDVPN
ncbi:MAG: hypothetical protein AAF433_15190 [Bacteroidota bacterium]